MDISSAVETIWRNSAVKNSALRSILPPGRDNGCLNSQSTATFSLMRRIYTTSIHQRQPELYAQAIKNDINTPSCISEQDDKRTQKWKGERKKAKREKWKEGTSVTQSHADFARRRVRLTTDQDCPWLSRRRSGWKDLWCWSCSAWFQSENM